jgi:hypothetical protein
MHLQQQTYQRNKNTGWKNHILIYGPQPVGNICLKVSPIRTAVPYDLLLTNMACMGLVKMLLPSLEVSPSQLDLVVCLLREQAKQYQSNQSSSSPMFFEIVLQRDRWYAASQKSHINILEDFSNFSQALHGRETTKVAK